MKAILMSVNPEWVSKILSKEKMLEIRKTIPKYETPYKLYIYCTKKHNYPKFIYNAFNEKDKICGKVVAECIVNKVNKYDCEYYKDRNVYQAIHKILNDEEDHKWVNRELVISNDEQMDGHIACELLNKACLTFEQLGAYLGEGIKDFYTLKIDNLIVYDKPISIEQIKRPCICPKMPYCPNCPVGGEYISEAEAELYRAFGECETEWYCNNYLKKAPQSWCYVEELTLNETQKK